MLLQNYDTLTHLFIFSAFPQVPLLLANLIIMPLRPNQKSWYKLLAFRPCRGCRPETLIYSFFICWFLSSLVTVYESYAYLLLQGWQTSFKTSINNYLFLYLLSVITEIHSLAVLRMWGVLFPWLTLWHCGWYKIRFDWCHSQCCFAATLCLSSIPFYVQTLYCNIKVSFH